MLYSNPKLFANLANAGDLFKNYKFFFNKFIQALHKKSAKSEIDLADNNTILLHATPNDIKKFGGNSRLSGLVVLQLERTKEFVGVVGGYLHGNHSSSVFGSQ